MKKRAETKALPQAGRRRLEQLVRCSSPRCVSVAKWINVGVPQACGGVKDFYLCDWHKREVEETPHLRGGYIYPLNTGGLRTAHTPED